MSNGTTNGTEFRYRTSTGEKVEVDLRWSPWDDLITWAAVILDASTGKRFRFDVKFGHKGQLTNLAKADFAFRDFTMDLIVTGEWRKKCRVFDPGNSSHAVHWANVPLIQWETMQSMGFSTDNDGNLRYGRRVEALAVESETARWIILEKAYRKADGICQLNDLISEKVNSYPQHVLHRETNVLKDLEFLTTIIDGIDQRDSKLIRLTGKGKRHYEEHVLPSHNMVFVIAPCREKWFTKSIKQMLKKKGLRYIIQEETEHRQETIREDILANIRACRFVIADISGKGIEQGERFNPNCVYELGYAHAQKKRIICSVNKDLIPESGLPFDFAGVRFSFWTHSKNKNSFAKEIRSRIEQLQDQFQREYWLKA